ncbi:MAG: Hint domain-containing protein [Rhizobiales bacterium]|nr:Hint domain-containing protein [Hyphomicrobiales bacterium]
MNRRPVTSPARRHFMGIVAAGAGRLSTIAIASSLLAVTKTKTADAMGLFPRDDPNGPSPHCFAQGTLIRTADGETPVEDLAVGAFVMTTNGARPVKWIGRQVMSRNGSACWHPSVVPVRVSRFAIDDQTPQRDLYLSQEHCLLIDGALIPVKYLVNGCSIAFDEDAKSSETIAYFCVELDTHEAVFAEGAAAETFRHWGGRLTWDNLEDYRELYGTEHEVTPAFAPIYRYSGGRAEVGGLLRLAASRFVDVRDPIQIAHDRIAARAMARAA